MEIEGYPNATGKVIQTFFEIWYRDSWKVPGATSEATVDKKKKYGANPRLEERREELRSDIQVVGVGKGKQITPGR